VCVCVVLQLRHRAMLDWRRGRVEVIPLHTVRVGVDLIEVSLNRTMYAIYHIICSPFTVPIREDLYYISTVFFEKLLD